MQLKDLQSLAPLISTNEPAKICKNDPNDLSQVRRASVAIIIRYRGNDQEVLSIKRRSRANDRWSGHIAFPGGKQEPGESDFVTAVREVNEEVGIDLSKSALYLGPLEPRLIRDPWERKVAMVLCPFVFAIRNEFYEIIPTPQESEVAVVFWYPLALLYSTQHRNYEIIPIVNRLGIKGIIGNVLMYQAGDILFDAVDIWPQKSSLYKSNVADLPPAPWKMWGITWGLMQEIRSLIDQEMTVNDIKVPQFSAFDFNALLTLVSAWSLRRKRIELKRSQSRADWTSKLVVGHFRLFPLVIILGTIGRLVSILYIMKLAYKLGRR